MEKDEIRNTVRKYRYRETQIINENTIKPCSEIGQRKRKKNKEEE